MNDAAGTEARRRLLRDVRLLVLDVDGVLTDGRLHYSANGEEVKIFHVHDGVGIRAIQSLGVQVAIITGRGNPALRRRMSDLGVVHVHENCHAKGKTLLELMVRCNLKKHQVLCVGDDTPDLDMLPHVCALVAVENATHTVRATASWITMTRGGAGAVREVCDEIVAAHQDAVKTFRVVIPARFGSTRLPGKPLIKIHGKTIIAHAYDRGVESGAREVIVATDSSDIATAVKEFGGDVEMTSPNHSTGTSRIAEVAASRRWNPQDLVVNLQGDEPAMPAENIRSVAALLAEQLKSGLATLATPIGTWDELHNPNIVKVIRNRAGLALYFSRAPIPWPRPAGQTSDTNDGTPINSEYLRHLGIYSYRVASLLQLASTQRPTIEQVEDLEQLRALHLGMGIAVGVVDNAPPHGVDTEADLVPAAQALASYRDRRSPNKN